MYDCRKSRSLAAFLAPIQVSGSTTGCKVRDVIQLDTHLDYSLVVQVKWREGRGRSTGQIVGRRSGHSHTCERQHSCGSSDIVQVLLHISTCSFWREKEMQHVNNNQYYNYHSNLGLSIARKCGISITARRHHELSVLRMNLCQRTEDEMSSGCR
jgi:hypothetical protein